jgi:hypothetical protein
VTTVAQATPHLKIRVATTIVVTGTQINVVETTAVVATLQAVAETTIPAAATTPKVAADYFTS